MPEEPTSEEMTLDTLRGLANRTGLEIPDDELADMMPGVLRNLAMAKAVRKWADAGVEPSTASLAPRS